MATSTRAISSEGRVRRMNDRHLYRAKRKDSGEWIVGYYVIGLDMYEKEVHMIFEPTTIFYSHGETDGFVDVDPSTICQCTGLKDKNGKLIWENDICRRILFPTKRIKTIFRIAYVPYKCCLSAIDLDGSNVTFLSDYINNQYEVEVIGNIFDNPELLEVGE